MLQHRHWGCHYAKGCAKEEGKEPLEQIFKRIGVRYVHWVNWKYKRSGHRFKSEPVQDDAYFLTALRYIYQNPVKAGLCQTAEDYPWSSFQTLGQPAALVTHELALTLLPQSQLRQYLNERNENDCLDMGIDSRPNNRDAMELIRKTCRIKTPEEFRLLREDQQGHFIRTLHEQRRSIHQLSRLLGASKGQVERILQR